MTRFETVQVTDARAARLLDEYFAFRALDFPEAQGRYTVARPDPARFSGDAGVFVLVLGEDGEAVGCGGIKRIDDSTEGRARFEVKHIWVRPTARGSGLGRQLLEELERHAAQRGADQIVLDTNDSLTAAGALYRSHGYTEIPAYNDNPNATTWYAKPAAARDTS